MTKFLPSKTQLFQEKCGQKGFFSLEYLDLSLLFANFAAVN